MRRRSQSPRGTSLRSTLLSSTAKTDVEVTGVASAPLDYGRAAPTAFLRSCAGWCPRDDRRFARRARRRGAARRHDVCGALRAAQRGVARGGRAGPHRPLPCGGARRGRRRVFRVPRARRGARAAHARAAHRKLAGVQRRGLPRGAAVALLRRPRRRQAGLRQPAARARAGVEPRLGRRGEGADDALLAGRRARVARRADARAAAAVLGGGLYAVQTASRSSTTPTSAWRARWLWSTTLATLVLTLSQSLFAVLWYTYATYTIAGWQGPLFIFGFFVASASYTARRLADRRPRRRRRGEGDFRRAHIDALQGAEAAALAGGAAHDEALGGAWRSLLRRRWRLILRQLALNVALYSTDYMGSVVDYLAIAAAICAGMYDGLSPHDVVQIVSRGAGFAISLVYGFTQIVDCATQAMQLSGYLAASPPSPAPSTPTPRSSSARPPSPAASASSSTPTEPTAAAAARARPPLVRRRGAARVDALAVSVPAAAGRAATAQRGAAAPLKPLVPARRRRAAAHRRLGRRQVVVAPGDRRAVARRRRRRPLRPAPRGGRGGGRRERRRGRRRWRRRPGGRCVFVPQAARVLPVASLRQQLAHPLGAAAVDDAVLGSALRVVGLSHSSTCSAAPARSAAAGAPSCSRPASASSSASRASSSTAPPSPSSTRRPPPSASTPRPRYRAARRRRRAPLGRPPHLAGGAPRQRDQRGGVRGGGGRGVDVVSVTQDLEALGKQNIKPFYLFVVRSAIFEKF